MKKNSLGRLVNIYTIVWAIAILLFWVASLLKQDVDAMGYSTLVFYLVMPVTTIVISLLIGNNKKIDKNKKYILPVFFGIMFMLVEYLTFSLSNMITFSKFNIPEISLLLIGMVISYVGIFIGMFSKKRNN